MNANLRQLESEAEAARAKLAADLAVLRSPSTYSEFKDGLKQEAMDARDAVLDSVRSNVKSTAESWIDEIKAKAAANPGAALLIGAGVAWRLLQNPPIATALVGAGLFSLLRTSRQPGHRYMSDAAYLEEAKHRLKEQASDLALSAKERAAELAGSAKARTASLVEGAKDRAAGAIDDVSNAAIETRDHAKRRMAAAADYSATAAGNGYAAVQRTARDAVSEQGRDKLLLGAAGIAVTAALTLALQRRISGSA